MQRRAEPHLCPIFAQSSYLATNDGPHLVIWGGGGPGNVRVTVAKATGAVEVEAGRSDCGAGHGGVVH